jgi:hypothetical protein
MAFWMRPLLNGGTLGSRNMGIAIARWRATDPESAIAGLGAAFSARTGLTLHVELLDRAAREPRGSRNWSVSVPALALPHYLGLGVLLDGVARDWDIEGEFSLPVHRYLWHQMQASFAVVGARPVRVSPNWALPSSVVPAKWDAKWADLPTVRRIIYSHPWLWPLWRS